MHFGRNGGILSHKVDSEFDFPVGQWIYQRHFILGIFETLEIDNDNKQDYSLRKDNNNTYYIILVLNLSFIRR